jgi:hypothetical protein
MRVLPKFDPHLDDPLPLTPSEDAPLVHTIQYTQPPATQLEAEIAEGDILYQLAFRKVVRLRNGQVVKCGLQGLRCEEATTMIYIATHTTVPIPGNVQFVEENGKSYLCEPVACPPTRAWRLCGLTQLRPLPGPPGSWLLPLWPIRHGTSIPRSCCSNFAP